MSKSVVFTLKAGERIFINGAVLRAECKMSLSLLNEACFLLEAYVMQHDAATTPLRQLYFLVQSLVTSPATRTETQRDIDRWFGDSMDAYRAGDDVELIFAVRDEIARERYFDSLKKLRRLFCIDDEIHVRGAFAGKAVAGAAIAASA